MWCWQQFASRTCRAALSAAGLDAYRLLRAACTLAGMSMGCLQSSFHHCPRNAALGERRIGAMFAPNYS